MIVSPTNGVSCTLTASGTTYNTAWSWYSQSNNIKEFRLSSGVELGPNLNYMFHDASNLATLDVSNWNTSNVTNMNYMFEGASSLTTLDVSNWNISNVTDMWGMFYHASSLTSLDVSKWDTSKVARMGSMFYYASKLTTLDISDWNTSNVADMSGMFFGASSLTTLDLTGWDTSSVANMSYMFGETPNLSKISYGPNFAWKNNHGSLGEAPSGRYTSKWAILQDGNITDGTPEGTYATGTQYAVSELPSNPSETITIVWHQNTPKYTITYSAGDKGTFGDISYTQNLNEATKQPDTDSLTSINGYDFAGWDKEVQNTATSDATYTALWKRRFVSFKLGLAGDDDEQAALEAIEVQLYQNGEPYEDVVSLDVSNTESYSWEQLPEYSEDGTEKYTYTVKLANVPEDYEDVKITSEAEDGATINFAVKKTSGETNPAEHGDDGVSDTSAPKETNPTASTTNPRTEDNVYVYIISGITVLGATILMTRKLLSRR